MMLLILARKIGHGIQFTHAVLRSDPRFVIDKNLPSGNEKMLVSDYSVSLKNPSGVSDFAVKATAADKGELVSLLERCYMFLADNTHEAEEDAAELMAAIEKAIDLNAG